jgi:hypothetical protein
VEYTITYTGADSVSLSAADVSLVATGTATGSVAVSGTGLVTRTVSLSGLAGDGTLRLLLAAGTAQTSAGGQAAAAGPSDPVTVDNSTPTISSGTPATGGQWTWIAGSDTHNAAGVYGTQGVADPANTPGARWHVVSWLDRQGRLMLFGGRSGLDRYGDLWRFDGTNWTWIGGANTLNSLGTYGTQGAPALSNWPGARTHAGDYRSSSGGIRMFGGWGYDTTQPGALSDLWSFEDTAWTWLGGPNVRNQPATYGTQGTPAAANVPGARENSVVGIGTGGSVWVFGGYGQTTLSTWGRLNDLWNWDGAQWTWVSGSSTHNAAGVYGTRGVAAPANVPGARLGAAGYVDGSGHFWIFGGFGIDSTGAAGALDDVWKFDGAQWTWVAGSTTASASPSYGTQGVPAASNTPGARMTMGQAVDGAGRLWIFGGGGLYTNDLWRWDGTAWTWMAGSTQVGPTATYGTRGVPDPANIPGGREGCGMWIDAAGNVWILGGLGKTAVNGLGLLNDLWRYAP